MAKDIQSEVRNIISEIEEKAADGNYIYRGEPKRHKQVSSGLWRKLESTFTIYDSVEFNFDEIQESYLRDARRYGRNLHQDDFELASELQHLGGKCNLIDFTKSLLVALFFACDGAYDKPGRVILLKQTEEIKNKYKIKEPRNPMNRVIAQKSIFVQPSRGFIEQDDIKTVCVKAELKESILTYLRKHHGIYPETVYNDLEGYIKHQKNYRKAYREYGRGQAWCLKNPGQIVEVNGNPYDDTAPAYTAIDRFDKAIKLYPDFVEAYYARAEVYFFICKFDKAIDDFNRAIELNPDYASAYACRGSAYSKKGCDDRAIDDFNRAIELDPDGASAYVHRGLAYRCKGCYDRAIADFRRAIELSDNSDNARALLEETQSRRESEGAGEVESIN